MKLVNFVCLQITKNGQKWYQKCSKNVFCDFWCFRIFCKFFGFSVKMTFLDFLLMIIHSWSKNLSKVHEIWPILFQIFWLNFSSKSIWVHQVPPTHKWAKIALKSFEMGLLGTQIFRDWEDRFIFGLKNSTHVLNRKPSWTLRI